MRKTISGAALALATLTVAAAAPMKWNVDVPHTGIEFKVNHFFTPVSGKFDDYQCYKVQNWDGKIVNPSVKVEDQFGRYGQYAARPVLLCNPVSINGKKIRAPEVHLVCYQTDPNNDRDLKEQAVAVHNIFGDHKLKLERVSQLLCVTSTKKHLK